MGARRDFYEDDEVTVTEPGLNQEISDELKAKESIQVGKDVSIFNGMTIRAPEFANKILKQWRLTLYEKTVLVENELSTTKSAIDNELKIVQQEYHELVQEPVLPSAIYILTGALTGSIVARNRALPLRFLSPLLFGGVVFKYTMPRTFARAADSLDNFEKRFPEVYDAHRAAETQARQAAHDTIAYKDQLDGELVQAVAATRKFVKDLLEK